MKYVTQEAMKEIADKYDLDQLILLCRNHDAILQYRVTFGRTPLDCDLAEMDARKIDVMFEALPNSLREAIKAARNV